MCHIKDLSNQFVEKVEDVVKEGDEITVKFMGIDDKGRFNLSRKALLPKAENDDRGSRPVRADHAEGEDGGERPARRPRKKFFER